MGSKLEAKINDCNNDCIANSKSKIEKCKYLSKYIKIWFTLFQTREVDKGVLTQCIRDKLALNFDNTTNSWYSKEKIRVRHQKQLQSMDILDKSNFFTSRQTIQQSKLIDYLISKGQVELTNLFGFPYDWRYTVDSFEKDTGEYPAGTFQDLKMMIEDAYNLNKLKVTLITHSMGGLITNQFLNNQVTQEWQSKYVNKFIPISCPWGGSMVSLKSIITGNNLDIPFVKANKFKDLMWSIPSGLFLLPVEGIIKTNQKKQNQKLLRKNNSDLKLNLNNNHFKQRLMSINPEFSNNNQIDDIDLNYAIKAGTTYQSLGDIPKILCKIGDDQICQGYSQLKSKNQLLSEQKLLPKLPITFIQSKGVKTVKFLTQKKDFEQKQDQKPNKEEKGDGDGTVNIESLQFFKDQVNQQNISPLYEVALEGFNHTEILTSQQLFSIINSQLEIDQ